MNIARLVSCFHPGCQPAPRPAARDSPARTTAARAARRPRCHPKSVADILLAAMYSPRYTQILFPELSRNTPERRTRSFSAGKRCACQPGFASEILLLLLRVPNRGEILGAGSGLVHPFPPTRRFSPASGAERRRYCHRNRPADSLRKTAPRYRGRRLPRQDRADRGKLPASGGDGRFFRQRRPAG